MARDYLESSKAPSGCKATGVSFGRDIHTITHPTLGIAGHTSTTYTML